jgi:predicted acylesterase/phospholipase RssA
LSELRELNVRFDFTLMQTLEPESILDLPNSFGLDTGENLEKLVRALLKTRGLSPEITFAELAAVRPGLPRLRVFATDLNSCSPREFSEATSPNTPIYFAVVSSMSVPLYFQPRLEESTGHLLVDGGVIANFPFHLLTEVERAETLGILFSGDHKFALPNGIQTFSQFIHQIYYSIYHHHNKSSIDTWPFHVLVIPCGEFPALGFDMTSEQRTTLIEAGRSGAEEFLARGPLQGRSGRRNSI